MSFSEDDMSNMENLLHLVQQRDAAIIRYIHVERELTKHRSTVERYENEISELVSNMPADVATQARKRAQKDKPWEKP